jgi:hypothetical protein
MLQPYVSVKPPTRLEVRMMATPQTGERLRCAACGTEVIVLQPPDAEAPGTEPSCCGQPMTDVKREEPARGE